jgi:hypothetical protein
MLSDRANFANASVLISMRTELLLAVYTYEHR